MNDQKKRILHLLPSGLSAVLVAVFLCISLVAFSSMNKSAAWFASSQNVSAGNMSVTILNNQQDITATITSYAVTDISADGVYTAANTQKYDIPLNDPEEILPSEYKQALVVVVDIVSINNESVSLSLTIPNDSILSYGQNNVFSNCAKITPADYDPNSHSATISSTQSSMSFVSLTPTVSKTTYIDLATGISLVANTPTTLCYVIEYDLDVLKHIRSQTLTSGSSMPEIIYFYNDLNFTVS